MRISLLFVFDGIKQKTISNILAGWFSYLDEYYMNNYMKIYSLYFILYTVLGLFLLK